MMALWLACSALTLLAAYWLARPLLRGGRRAPAPRLDYDLAVYRDQLRELERDRARGLLGEEEAAAARTEIERRVLSASQADPPARQAAPEQRAPALALLFAALALPVAAGALYLALGQPGLPSMSAGRDAPPSDRADAKRLAELERKAAQNPARLADRLALAEYHFEQRRFRSAAENYRLALDLARGRPDIAALLGEALTRASGGMVTEPARRAFEQALAGAPRDPRARFFLGLADAQAGRHRQALVRWLSLEAEAAADAGWLATLRQEIARVAQEGEIDVAALRRELGLAAAAEAPPQPGPSQKDVAEAEKLAPAERMAMIRGMVERLEARLRENPADLDGWKRLGRSFSVLEEHAKAAQAYRRAHELAPGEAGVLADYAAALIRAQPAGEEITAPIEEVLRKLLARDPGNGLALFYLGLAEAGRNNKDAAAQHWKKLLAMLPADAPIREMVKKRLAEIGAGE
jgi:cytochrome c-type biogenesis protein CcmH